MTWKQNKDCPSCGGALSLGVYYNEQDERFNASCFKCKKYYHMLKDNENDDLSTNKPVERYNSPSKYNQLSREDIIEYKYADVPLRNIDKRVYEYYGVKMSVNERNGEADTIYYPYYIKNSLASYKVRKLPKEWLASVGSLKGVGLFGEHLCKGGKRLYITEGEEDALAVYFVLRSFFKNQSENKEYRPSVVSLTNGAGSLRSSLKAAKKLLDKYKEIVYIPDADEEGKKSIQQAYSILKGKMRIVNLPCKDASEMVQEGENNELLSLLLKPEIHRPGRLLTFGEVLDQCTLEPDHLFTRPYTDFCKDLNYKTGGRRFGDLDLFIAGTSLGKSSFMREIVLYDLLKDSSDKIGVMFLEESTKRFGDAMVSLKANKRFHIDQNKDKYPELFTSIKKTMKDDWSKRLMAYEHNSTEIEDDDFRGNLEYMVEEFGAKWIFIDHLHLIVEGGHQINQEMAKIDSLMDYLSKFVTKYDVWVGMAAHLRKTVASSGTNKYEFGLIPTLDDIKASGAAKQKGFQVIGLQRNLYHSNPTLRNVIALHVLKNRHSGRAGPADFLLYDEETGRMEKTSKPTEPLLERGSNIEVEL